MRFMRWRMQSSREPPIEGIPTMRSLPTRTITEIEAMAQERNAANADMAKLPKNSPEFAAKRESLGKLSGRIKDCNAVKISVGPKGLVFNGEAPRAAAA